MAQWHRESAKGHLSNNYNSLNNQVKAFGQHPLGHPISARPLPILRSTALHKSTCKPLRNLCKPITHNYPFKTRLKLHLNVWLGFSSNSSSRTSRMQGLMVCAHTIDRQSWGGW